MYKKKSEFSYSVNMYTDWLLWNLGAFTHVDVVKTTFHSNERQNGGEGGLKIAFDRGGRGLLVANC